MGRLIPHGFFRPASCARHNTGKLPSDAVQEMLCNTHYNTDPHKKKRESWNCIRLSLKKFLIDRCIITGCGQLRAIGVYLGCCFSFLTVLFFLEFGTSPSVDAVSLEDDIETHPVFFCAGDSGAAIKQLEDDLSVLGYDPGTCDGIFSLDTAKAVRAFQRDTGLPENGICSAAVLDALHSIYRQYDDPWSAVPSDSLAAALENTGCLKRGASASLRDALLLFQRTHGLCGSGQPDYATLCALGLCGSNQNNALPTDAKQDQNELQIYLLASYLARFSHMYPQACDLRSLTCVAATLLNRLQTPEIHGSLSILCAENEPSVPIPVTPDALHLHAAEDALDSYARGIDPTGGAQYYTFSGDALPPKYTITRTLKSIIFYR